MGLILLFPCIPGAFVILPREAIESEDEEGPVVGKDCRRGSATKKRLRTISAGVWHNALSAFAIAFLTYSGASNVMHQAMWRDADGIRVEGVDAVSP
jgi:hypothetical protein